MLDGQNFQAIRYITSTLFGMRARGERQTIIFAATLPDEIKVWRYGDIPLATPENVPQRATSTPHFLLVKWVFECAETV